MSDSREENRSRLFALNDNLRAEADRMLGESGLGKVIREEGFELAGSYVMRTMTWRDLDFERCEESPDWKKHWELGKKFAGLKWVWRLAAINAYEDPRNNDEGYYWGLRVSVSGEKIHWKLDLWTARQEEFDRGSPKRGIWESQLNDDTRYYILMIKETVCMLPEYKESHLSTNIYEAVLENGVRGIEEFWEWWKSNYGK